MRALEKHVSMENRINLKEDKKDFQKDLETLIFYQLSNESAIYSFQLNTSIFCNGSQSHKIIRFINVSKQKKT